MTKRSVRERSARGDARRSAGEPDPRRARSDDARATRWAGARAGVGIAALLAGAVLLCYARAWGHEFLYVDDDRYVFANPWVRGGIDGASVRWALTSFHAANWHPLTWLSHMLDCEWFGLAPAGHHGVNVVLHAMNAALLFLGLRALSGAPGPSAFVAALFALHPLRVESVAWVAERKDLLAGTFWMLALVAWAAWVRRPGVVRYAAVLAAFAGGLMAKPTVVTLPFVLLLFDVWPLGRWDGRSLAGALPRVLEKAPLFGMALASSVITVFAQRSGGAVGSTASVDLLDRAANAACSYLFYVATTLWPVGLSYFQPHPALDASPGGAWRAGAAAGALAAVVVSLVAWRALPRQPWLAVGWFFYLGTLVPMIGLLQVGMQARADRYTYLPSIGLYVALAWSASALLRRWPGALRPLAGAAALSLAALAAVTWFQLGHWRDTATLARHALEVDPRNYVALSHLGVALERGGDTPGALEAFRRAVEINPSYAEGLENLGVMLEAEGRHEEAALCFQRAIRHAPAYAEPHSDLGVVLERLGRPDEAEAEYRRAIDLSPGYALAHQNLAALLAARADGAGALEHYGRALAADPTLARSHLGLGQALVARGDLARALPAFESALAIEPDDPSSRNALGGVLLRMGRYDEAAVELERAVARAPDFVEARYNLGVALFQLGRPDEAAQRFEEALRLRPDFAPARAGLEQARAAER